MNEQTTGTQQAGNTQASVQTVESDTQAATIGRVTRFIFWIGFTAFLATSIPHVAWLWHLFEGTQSTVIIVWGLSVDAWWIISYAVAVGIDVLIAWLSFIQTIGDKTAGRITWVFIAALAVLSWYANYLYDMAHSPNFTGDIWSIGVLGGMTTTGYITPIIVSALPVFVVAYTFMLSRMGKGKKENAQALKVRADELEALQTEKARITALKREGRQAAIKGMLSEAVDLTKHTITTLHSSPQEQPAQPPQKAIEATAQVESVEAPAEVYVAPVAPPVDTPQDTEQPIHTDKLEATPVLSLPTFTTESEAPQVTTLPVQAEEKPASQNGHIPVYRRNKGV